MIEKFSCVAHFGDLCVTTKFLNQLSRDRCFLVGLSNFGLFSSKMKKILRRKNSSRYSFFGLFSSDDREELWHANRQLERACAKKSRKNFVSKATHKFSHSKYVQHIFSIQYCFIFLFTCATLIRKGAK